MPNAFVLVFLFKRSFSALVPVTLKRISRLHFGAILDGPPPAHDSLESISFIVPSQNARNHKGSLYRPAQHIPPVDMTAPC